MDVAKIKNLKDLLVVEQSEVTQVVAFDVNGNLVMGEYKEPDLSGYATEDWVKNQDYATNSDVDEFVGDRVGQVEQRFYDYYTKDEVDTKVENVQVDLSDYYTKGEVDSKLENAGGGDMSNYYTKEEIDNTIGYINNILTSI